MSAGTASRELPLGPPPAGTPSGGHEWRPPVAGDTGEVWPQANKTLTWMIAAFLVMLWVLPFDQIEANFAFPVDPKLDRVLLVPMMLAWLASVFAGGRPAPRWNRGPIDAALLLFVAIAVASVVLNVSTLSVLQESSLAFKKLGLLLSYTVFFFIVATSLRRQQVERFLALFTGLACVTAVGTLYQYWGGENLFFKLGDGLFPDALFTFTRSEASQGVVNDPVTGPAGHALALAAMFGIAFSVVLVYLLRAKDFRAKVLYGGLTLLILLGVFATSRKTGAFSAIFAASALLAYRPKEFSRYVPALLAAFVLALVFAPNAVDKQLEQLTPANVASDASGQARQADYEAVVPDVREYVVTGRGWGTYDHNKYRVLDNSWLGILIEVGLLGVAAMALLILAVFSVAHRLSRDKDLRRAHAGLAATGAAAAFGVCLFLFDAMGFAQVPYMFLFLAGLVVVARSPEVLDAAPERALAAPTEAPTDPLPALRDRLKLPIRREPHAPLFGRGLARRSRDDHEEPGPTVPVPSGPVHAGARRRVLPLSRIDRRQARNGVLGVLLIGFVVALFSGGGQQDLPGGPQLAGPGSGDDPFALDEYGGRQRSTGAEGRSRVPSGGGSDATDGAAPTTGRPTDAPVSAQGGGGSAPAPQQDVAGETRENAPAREHERPKRIEDETPRGRPKPKPCQTNCGPPPSDPKPDECLVPDGDAREIIREVLDRDPCGPDALDADAIREAFAAGELDYGQVAVLEDAYRDAARAADRGGAKNLLGGFTLLLVGGGALRRRARV